MQKFYVDDWQNDFDSGCEIGMIEVCGDEDLTFSDEDGGTVFRERTIHDSVLGCISHLKSVYGKSFPKVVKYGITLSSTLSPEDSEYLNGYFDGVISTQEILAHALHDSLKDIGLGGEV